MDGGKNEKKEEESDGVPRAEKERICEKRHDRGRSVPVT